MACQYCSLEIPENICQLCATLLDQDTRSCKECGLPLGSAGPVRPFCRVCNTMFENVRSSRWLTTAQTDWIHENFDMARRKRMLLGAPAPKQEQDPLAG